MKKRIAAWITLGLITLGSGFLLSMTNEVTKGTIEKQEAESKVIARQAVLSSAERFEAVEMPDLNPLTELYAGKVGDEVIGYVGTAVTSGYGGPVQVIAGIDNDGTVSGISVGSSDFNETAGLGSKAKDASFMEQFIGKQTPIRAVKATKDRAENTVDAITAATITTNAVTGAVNQIANKIDAYLNPDDGELAEGTTYTADAQGYAGPVAVFVTVKDDGTISALNVGDERFAETQGFGAAATEPGFTKQFIGKSFPLTIEDIDAISGATKTSQAVIDALNKAFEDKVVVEPAGPEGITYTAAEKGFAGPVAVFVTVDENAAITALTIGDDKFAETEGYGAGATERVFTKQFIGKTLPITIEDIDTISGATITSKAVVAGINRAYDEKLIDESSNGAAMDVPATKEPLQAEMPAISDDLRSSTSSSKGYDGPVAVTITLNEDDTIANIVVGDADFNETPGIGSKAQDEEFTNRFIGKKVPLAEGDVDVISGATITSEAVIKAVNKAADMLMPVEASEEAEPSITREAASSSKGYDGPVAVTITLNEDDTIAKIVVGDADFNETPGIGSKAQDEEFTSRFIGKKVPLAEGDVDVISGATITSEAVIKAVNKAADMLMPVEASEEAKPSIMREAASSSKGYDGPVAVTITLNEDDTIAKIVVGDADFNETPGIGSKAQDEEFTGQFIGKKVPLAEGDVDVISGATITSEAVIKAVNKAADLLISEVLREATSSSKGYDGTVSVTITLNEDDTIAKMEVGDTDFNETPGIGSKAQDEEFIGQFIGKKVPLAEGDVDVISGATITSEAVIKAVNKAADMLISEVLREATSSSKGYDGPVSVTITLNEDDTIAQIIIGDADFNETPGIGGRTQDEEFSVQFIGKKVPLAEGDVDVISGATITSEAVIKAVNKAADKLLQK